MRIGAFEVKEPVPELREPHAIAVLRPWIDAGNVGTLTLTWLERNLNAVEIARLARPGNFFDFTRYRPTILTREGGFHMVIPNTIVSWARGPAHDFLFFHLLEPQMLGEDFVEAVLVLLNRFGARRYTLIGSMYDMVPHTRPLLVSGRAFGKVPRGELEKHGIHASHYEGPSTITSLISQEGARLGVETMTMLVHLPQYTEMEEDFSGQVRLMQIFHDFYGIPVDETAVAKATEQCRQVDEAIGDNPQLKYVVSQLEEHYDSRQARQREEKAPQLSPEVEKFLHEMENRFGQGST